MHCFFRNIHLPVTVVLCSDLNFTCILHYRDFPQLSVNVICNFKTTITGNWS